MSDDAVARADVRADVRDWRGFAVRVALLFAAVCTVIGGVPGLIWGFFIFGSGKLGRTQFGFA